MKNAEIWLEKRLGKQIDIILYNRKYRNDTRLNTFIFNLYLGTKKGPPKIVNIINLNDSSDLPHMLGSLLGPATSTTPLDLSTLSFKDVVYANYAKFHSNMSFHVSPSSDLLNSLDAVRVADVVLFVTSYSADVTELISQVTIRFIHAY